MISCVYYHSACFNHILFVLQLLSQTDQLTKLNVNLRRKLGIMEKRSVTLASQCTDLQATCKEKDRQIKELHKRFVSQAYIRVPGIHDSAMLFSTNRVGELNETLKTSMTSSPNETQPDCREVCRNATILVKLQVSLRLI